MIIVDKFWSEERATRINSLIEKTNCNAKINITIKMAPLEDLEFVAVIKPRLIKAKDARIEYNRIKIKFAEKDKWVINENRVVNKK